MGLSIAPTLFAGFDQVIEILQPKPEEVIGEVQLFTTDGLFSFRVKVGDDLYDSPVFGGAGMDIRPEHLLEMERDFIDSVKDLRKEYEH